MKAYANEKTAGDLMTPDAEKKKKEEEKASGSGKPGSTNYVDGAKAGDPKAQRAVDRAGPEVVAKEVKESEKSNPDTQQQRNQESPQKQQAEGQQQGTEGQQQGERKKEPDVRGLEYGEDVAVPHLFGIKLAVMMHPAFHHQGKIVAEKGGNDAFILFYWTILQHDKIKNDSKIREFRNAVLQRAEKSRIGKAAEWVAQADKDEYTVPDLLDYLTGRLNPIDDLWKKTGPGRDNLVEMEEAVEGDYKDAGRVDAQSQGYFPLIDFVRGEEGISLKVVDPSQPDTLERIKKHLDTMNARKPMKDEKPLKLVLDLRVPKGMLEKAKELVDYGKDLNIEVKVEEQG